MNREAAFVDTNVFLRYLTDDVPSQAAAVDRLLERATRGEVLLSTSSLVVAEIVWTLDSFYGLGREAIHEKVLAILNTPGLQVTDADLVLQAIVWFADENVDYIDAFNAAWLQANGMSRAYTFDRKHFSRLGGITVITPGTENGRSDEGATNAADHDSSA